MTMTKKIFINIFLGCIAVLVSTIVIIVGVMYSFYGNELMSELGSEVNYVSSAVEIQGKDYLKTLSVEAPDRITWIDSDGTVLFDSQADPNKMENHLDRQEIKEALKGGTGTATRYSNTLSKKTMYYAKKLTNGTVLRVATDQYTVWVLLLNMLQPLLIVFIVSIVISYVIAYFASKKIVKPINSLDLENVETVQIYQEIDPLINRISRQNHIIKEQIKSLNRTNAEFQTITSNMKEGLVVIDTKGKVLSYNKSAKTLLSVGDNVEITNIRDFGLAEDFIEDMRKAIDGEHISEITKYDDKYLSIYCNPVYVNGRTKGAVTVILDVTEKEQREMLRKEFSSNVSHELKTPLTAILVSSEILMNENTNKLDSVHFAKNIYKEANRLITLVNDIIKLSRLDEKSVTLDIETIDLFEMAKNSVESLAPIADKSNIKIELMGGKTMMDGVPSILEEIIYNLCDNGIKYGKKDGSLRVTVAPINQHPTIIVEDNGIGICKEDQSRVFERFYRVDKSHSKEIGGTGLGLSIVKHGVEYHGGKLSIDSEPNKGTKITITF